MSILNSFTCVGEDMEPVPREVLDYTHVSYKEAFTKSDAMVKVAERLREVKKDVFTTLPFSVNIEAESLGAEVSIDEKFVTPRIKERTYKKLEDINHSDLVMELNKGTMKEVLDAIEKLVNDGEKVVLNVEGPLTILSMLVDTKNIYRAFIKNKELLLDVCDVLTEQLIIYMKEGVKRGAKIISYADPFAAYDLVSEKIYKDVCGEVSYRMLKKVQSELKGCVVHLCGKTSIGFEKAGFCKGERIKVESDITYGYALDSAVEEDKVKILGHRCMKCSAKKMAVPYLIGLRLTKPAFDMRKTA